MGFFALGAGGRWFESSRPDQPLTFVRVWSWATVSGVARLAPRLAHRRRVIAQPAGWDEKVEDELRYLDAEEIRLRYVAATRARELLVVGRWAKAGNGRPWGSFDHFLPR